MNRKSAYLLFFLFSLVYAQEDTPCLKQLSVDITDAQKQQDNSLVKDNVIYHDGSYYIEDGVTWGCLCNIKSCIQKCCHEDEINNLTCKTQQQSEFDIIIFNETDPINDLTVEDFSFVYSRNCVKDYGLYPTAPDESLYIQRNGSLYIEDYEYTYSLGYYCLTLIDGKVGAYFCEFLDQQQIQEAERMRLMYCLGMIISMPFLLATFLVYAILPDSNLHRKALMSYVLTLLLAYIFLVTVQLHDGQLPEAICELLGYSVIFFFMVSFFWMNVMCVDMWLAFSGLRGFGKRHTERKRFIFYCLYAWGMPVLHVIVVWLMNDYGAKDQIYYPGIGAVKCFLNDGYPNLFYFYGPMAILITINIVLFILTAVKIQKVKKETAMLKHSDSKRHSYEDDKQKFNLYLKLLFAMGINWTMEIISWAVNWKMGTNLPPSVWYLTDFCNAMYGAFIFFIFVFKKKIWKTLQKRYYVFIGKPHLAHSMTTTQTTRSSNYSTTETGLADHRLSELRNGRGEERVLTQN